MPPKTRGSKVSKASKENIAIRSKHKRKATIKVAKLPRKALADKTNSTSDDNASFVQSKPNEKFVRNEHETLLPKNRPRRDRRVPNRYIENNGLLNKSKGRNAIVEIQETSIPTPIKSVLKVVLSPLKTPKISLDSSLATRRPKRISRLPSKFDDHSVSPSKFVPVQPSYASTPKILSNTAKQVEEKNFNKNLSPKQAVASKNVTKANKKRTDRKKKTNDTNQSLSPNSSADTNNNAKKDELPRNKTKYLQHISPKASVPYTKATAIKKHNKVTDKNFSFRILEGKKKSLKRDASNLDVYEFTYDPNEEPPPQKKKRKKPAKKREPKPKTFVLKNNYDKNLAKALTALKNTVSAKAKHVVKVDNAKLLDTQASMTHSPMEPVVTTVETQPIPSNPTSVTCNSDKSHVSMKNYNSIRVEDIALDFEEDHYLDDVNYSPCPPSTSAVENYMPGPERSIKNNDPLPTSVLPISTLVPNRPPPNNDPLNLRDELSFFDDQPVASSSMNVSVRNPQASPWRVEFGSLPIKWQVNSYVKPNMTPAFDSSFINFNENKKKHVYTNIVPDTNEENNIPQIYEDNASKLKQTSIISFIREVIEKNAKKKKDKVIPIKANNLFEELYDASFCKGASLKQKDFVTLKKNAQSKALFNDIVTPPSQHVSEISNGGETDNSKEKENSEENVKTLSSKQKKDKDVTYFGFDDTNQDQENVTPSKNIVKRRLRALKPHSRAVLQEINAQKGPTRVALPVAVKSKTYESSETANKLFDQIKSANEPPVFPDKEPIQSTETTNITEPQNDEDSNDGQTVHLFEDMELVHHSKGHRKSYGKAKKVVTFRQNSISDSDVPLTDVAEHSTSSEEDNLHDLTFKIPTVEPKKTVKKKKSKKPKLSKKEEKEVEAWAAGFNSMCEDIEEFHLVVE